MKPDIDLSELRERIPEPSCFDAQYIEVIVPPKCPVPWMELIEIFSELEIRETVTFEKRMMVTSEGTRFSAWFGPDGKPYF